MGFGRSARGGGRARDIGLGIWIGLGVWIGLGLGVGIGLGGRKHNLHTRSSSAIYVLDGRLRNTHGQQFSVKFAVQKEEEDDYIAVLPNFIL